MMPKFLERLQDDHLHTILLCGCGGGFDFVHSLLLYPTLRAMGKKVIIGSYSFGDPHNIESPAPIVFQDGEVIVKHVSSSSQVNPHYAPEIHVCAYLDEHYPDEKQHHVYAYYARDFTVSTLTKFYTQLIKKEDIQAIIVVDGGSDSLMRGDEEGLGDPVEDAVSVATIAELPLPYKVLISVGLGVDRFNHVSDASSLRAIAELTQMNGFLGSIGLEPNASSVQFHRNLLEYIYQRQTFRSVLASMILASIQGSFGNDAVPPYSGSRLHAGGRFFVWPLMAMLWAFDVDIVAKRSLMVDWIRDATTPSEAWLNILHYRAEHLNLLEVENLPTHESMRSSSIQ